MYETPGQSKSAHLPFHLLQDVRVRVAHLAEIVSLCWPSHRLLSSPPCPTRLWLDRYLLAIDLDGNIIIKMMIDLVSPFYGQGNRGLKRSHRLPKVTQPVSGAAWEGSQGSQAPQPLGHLINSRRRGRHYSLHLIHPFQHSPFIHSLILGGSGWKCRSQSQPVWVQTPAPSSLSAPQGPRLY